MTDDEQADLSLLSLANHKRKFALEIGTFPPNLERLQGALERGIDARWFELVDVSPLSEGGAYTRVFRIFRLTDAGMERLAQLATLKGTA